jgi:hypothetical protein
VRTTGDNTVNNSLLVGSTNNKNATRRTRRAVDVYIGADCCRFDVGPVVI